VATPPDDNDPMSDVPSPCNSVCRMSPATGFCEGCFRSLDEIAAWSRMDDDEKRAVWRLLDERREETKAP
jgi:hypothetical protein